MLADTLSTFTQHLDILPHEYLRRDLPSGRVIAITDTAASGLPTNDDWLLCVYASADAFADADEPVHVADSDSSVCDLDTAAWHAVRCYA